jgi:haloacetate dehalogenase
MSDGIIEGFQRRTLPGEGIEIDALVAGDGPPLLLLHGFPQTRMCWRGVARVLTDRFTVVVPDLRGYGRSGKPVGGGDHAAYSKRMMARDQVATMSALGFERFAVAGHDRGGRVGYRLALDHPERVSQLCVLDIIPTAEVWRSVDADVSAKMWHWPFLSQPESLPERMIAGDPDYFLNWMLGRHNTAGFEYPAAALTDYLHCGRNPDSIHGYCEDYRAGFSFDRALDEADRGKRRITAPLLVLWGATGNVAKLDPIGTWRAWADEVQGQELPGGHFVPEEQPEAVADLFKTFFDN